MTLTPLSSYIAREVEFFCVGSLPHRSAFDAAEFVLERPWILPFWPELPQKDPAEFMVPRSEHALGQHWRGYREQEASGLFALREKLTERSHPLPILKGQIVGPLTHAAYSEVLGGHFEEKVELAAKNCLRQLDWQREFFGDCVQRMLFVLDEPGLVGWSQLSEAEQKFARDQWSYLYVSAAERGCYLGIHSCAPLMEQFFDLPCDLLSFDALDSAHVQTALPIRSPRQQLLAPGVVPSSVLSDARPIIDGGHRRFLEIQKSFPACPRLLFAANCGHGLADEGWVHQLYAEVERPSVRNSCA